jgi:hypothetical protein
MQILGNVNVDRGKNYPHSDFIGPVCGKRFLFGAPSLYPFVGELIKEFAFALVIGIIIGTYSSIAIASPLLVMWDDYKGKK